MAPCRCSVGGYQGYHDVGQAIKGADDWTRRYHIVGPDGGCLPRVFIMTSPLLTMMPATDTTSAAAVCLPILVYQSPRKPGRYTHDLKAASIGRDDERSEPADVCGHGDATMRCA